jgi:hypothetical protein
MKLFLKIKTKLGGIKIESYRWNETNAYRSLLSMLDFIIAEIYVIPDYE